MTCARKRIGIFGWGVVAPKSRNIEAFEKNLSSMGTWLTRFDGFGPNYFLTGQPDFEFSDYKPWIDERFEPRKFAQLDAKMGNMIKYAIGAFVQSLGQNPGIEKALQDLGQEAHIYVGTGLGDYAVQHEISINYDRAQRKWNRFWCQDAQHKILARYHQGDADRKEQIRQEYGAPDDPDQFPPDSDARDFAREAWNAFWLTHSDQLQKYLDELREVEGLSLEGDVDANKGHLIRKKAMSRKRLNMKYGCPDEPWTSVDPKLLWNIANIPGAQISMLGKITGPVVAPIAACSGFGTSLKLADNAIQLGLAKMAVVGMADPAPHPLTVAAFFGARVVSHDGEVSKPFTGMRGTHVAGGSCIWIVGDYDYCTSLGMKPVGLEILSVALTSDADHIITPSDDGQRAAMRRAMDDAGIQAKDVATWDMHATATPGDWTELQNAMSILPKSTALTARKGTFGHGMSVCGGWELTAQHLGLSQGKVHPIHVSTDELHEQIKAFEDVIVTDERLVDGTIAGKINMGVGGVNACVISKRWD
ncbi:MAG: beta-ketoacyl synthase [Acidobacteria bacterium]|nr:beta-ketoacyl synthase [Acidobacteriota bacterium]